MVNLKEEITVKEEILRQEEELFKKARWQNLGRRWKIKMLYRDEKPIIANR